MGSSIQDELDRMREQILSVKGKDTPFRVEFRYRGGTKHWQYFVSIEDAKKAEDSSCRYGPTGREIIERPTSQQIQKIGPRGGWSRLELFRCEGCEEMVDEVVEDAGMNVLCKRCASLPD